MSDFIGEIECKLDTKGRMLFPARFLKQMPAESSDRLFINVGFAECLNLYTYPEFTKITAKLKALNNFNSEARKFTRWFMRGTSEVTLDSSNRMLIPKRLVEVAKLKKEVILLGCFNRIELWDKNAYMEATDVDADIVGEMADKMLGQDMMNLLGDL